MYFVIVPIRTSDECSRGKEAGREINVNLRQELFCFPGGDVSCYHDQPCSCNDAWGWSDPSLTSLSSLTLYPGPPANHNPDLSGQSASKYDLLHLVWVQLWCVSQRVFSHLSSHSGPLCHYSWAGLQKTSEERAHLVTVPKKEEDFNTKLTLIVINYNMTDTEIRTWITIICRPPLWCLCTPKMADSLSAVETSAMKNTSVSL